MDALPQNTFAAFAVAKPDCLVGTDDLPTSFYRRADRCAAGLAGVVGHTATRCIAFQTTFWYSRPSENERSEFLRSQNFSCNTFPRNQNRHAVSSGRGIVGTAVLVRRCVVVDVVGQRVAVSGRFRLSDRQCGGVPKTGRRQAVGSGNGFTAALSGGRAAEHGVLAARQGEDGAGS